MIMLNLPLIKSKFNNPNSVNQIMLIKPEIEWLCKGLKEMIKLSRKDEDSNTDIINMEENILSVFEDTIRGN